MIERRRRIIAVLGVALFVLGSTLVGTFQERASEPPALPPNTISEEAAASALATEALKSLPVKGRAPKTGYSRTQFSADWQDVGACDMRNYILKRDLSDVQVVSETDCRVENGTLHDPYTGQVIAFARGAASSSDVQIDHVVALSDAWQKGAQQLTAADRYSFANDPLNLLAVAGKANQNKADSDAATWLPPNKNYRCRFVARQIAVKQKYELWVTQTEHDAMQHVLASCPGQRLPVESLALP